MVPDKFNMVDMDGIDLIMAQGEEVPGLYNRLVESIAQCRYQCLYNWFFDGVVIPPSYVEMEVNEDEEVSINEGITVSSDDVIHIYSISPTPVDPEIIPLLAEENGVYNVPTGKDGFNPVTVDVPSYTPVINPISITENGTYTVPTGVDGYSPVTVDVPSYTPVINPISITENGTYTVPTGVDGYSPVTVNVAGGQQMEVTATVQNDTVVVDGCSIVSQPVIINGKMSATSSQGLQVSVNYLQNVCLEIDYKYINSPSVVVFSLGGSNNSSGGVLALSNSLFEFYAGGSRIRRTDLNINFDQERHIKFIATATDELYVVVDNVLVLSASNGYVHNILNYCLSQNNNIAVGWNQSAHAEYNSGTFNNMKISFDVDVPNS